MIFSETHKKARARFIDAIKANESYHLINKGKKSAQFRDKFSFLTSPDFNPQKYDVTDTLSFISKRKNQHILIIVGLISLILFACLFIQTWNEEIDNLYLVVGGIIFLIIDLLIVAAIIVRNNDFELTSTGIIFTNKVLIPYNDIVFIHFKFIREGSDTGEYLVFRFNNRPKKEINIKGFAQDKRVIGERIYSFLKVNHGGYEGEIIDS